MKKNLLIFPLAAALMLLPAGCGATAVDVAVEITETEAVELAAVDAPEAETETEEVIGKAEATEETETGETEATKEAETEVAEDAESETDYTVMELSATKYAKSSVNVRTGPSTDYDKLGALSTNQEVTVTGQCNETGWYRIEYDEEAVAFVSDSYLVNEKVATTISSSTSGSDESSYTTEGSGTSEYYMTDEEIVAALQAAGRSDGQGYSIGYDGEVIWGLSDSDYNFWGASNFDKIQAEINNTIGDNTGSAVYHYDPETNTYVIDSIEIQQ